jgi:alpha-N-arabinofuranosidase
MKNTIAMEEQLQNHIALLDQYDPDNTIGLMADEYGNWHDVESGTNPAFLYQQNTLRDAVTAALYLNIYNNHARRVKMANIAQTINVLQAMLLTKNDKMVKTPTFYVFKMFKVHQDALLLPIYMVCEDYQYNDMNLPAISVSASMKDDDKIHISLTNINPGKNIPITVELRGNNGFKKASGSIITAETMNALNDFDKPEKVNIQPFRKFEISENAIEMTVPAKSVITIEVNL